MIEMPRSASGALFLGRKKYLERVHVYRVMYIHVYVCVQININMSTAVRASFIPEGHSICSRHHS